MRSIVATVAIILATGFMALPAWAGGVNFTTKPSAVKDGSGLPVKIAFAVSGGQPATDVEVAVVNADGKVVRHLAAGVLGGKNPPPEPLKGGLAQELTWDGKDDAGKDAGAGGAAGPFKVRVRAGMTAVFGKIIGASPWAGMVGDTGGLAVAPDGTLYVKMASVVGGLHQLMPWHLRQFDRTGGYQKTILPYPPSADPAKVPAFKLIDAGDKLLVPTNQTPLDPVLFHLGDSIGSRLIDGCVVFLDSREGRLNFVKVDGANVIRTVPMRKAADKLKWNTVTPIVAFSPDGKIAYYSNLANIPYDPKTLANLDPKFPQGRIYRHEIGKDGAEAEKFFDLTLANASQPKIWLPNAWNRRSAAAGIDTDAKGNILVGDLVDQQVVEISPEGKQISATKVDWPDQVAVNRKSGDIYVVSRKPLPNGGVAAAELLKITGRGESAKIVAKLPLPGALGLTIAVDESADVKGSPVVWVGGGERVIRVEDRGDKLQVASDLGSADKNAIGFVCYADVDPENDLVYVTQGMGPVWRYNGQTGEGGLTPIKACDLAVGPGGFVYAWGDTGSYAGPITRYGRDLKPAPLASTGKHTYGNLSCRFGRGNSVAGLDVDPRGWVYATNGGNSCAVQAWDADGKPVQFDRQVAADPNDKAGPRPAMITGMTDQSGSIRVDGAGNVYVLQIGWPKGHVPPAGFEKDPAYQHCTGTIYKFGPKGGEFAKGQAAPPVGSLLAYSTACGPISGNWNSTISVCHCTKPRFEVDGFGRLYIPNPFTYKVVVRDNADNEIASFGGYGNFDAQGPASGEPTPEIPLGWPITVGASEKSIYVGDSLNHRVVRADKKFAAEETCDVK